LEHSDNRVDEPGGWSLAASVSLPACLLNRQLHYWRVNRSWQQYLRDTGRGIRSRPGGQTVESDGRSFLLDVPDDRRERWADGLAAILDGRLGQFVDETLERGSWGEHITVMMASPALGSHGTVDGVVCVRYDLPGGRRGSSSEQQLLEVLEASRRLQHYLGNELALTLGYVELMTLDARLPPELRERVDEALRGVVEATETLAKLRALTRLEVGPDDPWLADALS